MGRFSEGHSYGHRCFREGGGWYRISWTVDYYYSGSRLRFPRGFSRDTDAKGAKRFCKKWGVQMIDRTRGGVGW